MADLISRAAAIEYLMTNMGWRDEDGYEVDDADEKRAIITDLVNGIPAVDAVSVVRCHKCIHWDRETVRQNSNDVSWWNEAICERHTFDGLDRIEKWTDADWFCADGERRDDDVADAR